ncbi:MAG: signal peptidase II [archaeon]|nr:signal peptidase II [archaeon]
MLDWKLWKGWPMMKEGNGKLILIAFIIIVLDQLSKFYAKHNWDYVINYGASFSILQGYRWLFIIVAILVIFLIFYYNEKKYLLAFGFILGGTIGNLIDRVFLGYVIDFVDIKIIPIFNVADIANTVGAILLLIGLAYGSTKHRKK